MINLENKVSLLYISCDNIHQNCWPFWMVANIIFQINREMFSRSKNWDRGKCTIASSWFKSSFSLGIYRTMYFSKSVCLIGQKSGREFLNICLRYWYSCFCEVLKSLPLFLRSLREGQFGSLWVCGRLVISWQPCCFCGVLPSTFHLWDHPEQTEEEQELVLNEKYKRE